MEYTMDDVKRMLRKASEIIRSGIAEDATDADREKMDRLLSNDAAVCNAMIESLLAPEPETEKNFWKVPKLCCTFGNQVS